MEKKEIIKNRKKVELAGGLSLFIGTIYIVWSLGILISGYENVEIGLGLLLGGIIYTPLGYFVLYKKNRWAAFSILIILVLAMFSNFLSGYNGIGLFIVLILIPIYKGTEAAFKLHTYSIKNMEKSR